MCVGVAPKHINSIDKIMEIHGLDCGRLSDDSPSHSISSVGCEQIENQKTKLKKMGAGVFCVFEYTRNILHETKYWNQLGKKLTFLMRGIKYIFRVIHLS